MRDIDREQAEIPEMTGDELKALRKACALTHAEMASAMGCSLLAYIDAEQTTSHLNRDQQILAEFVSLQLALLTDDQTLARPEIRKMTAAFAKLMDRKGSEGSTVQLFTNNGRTTENHNGCMLNYERAYTLLRARTDLL